MTDNITTMDVTLTIALKLDLGEGIDLGKVSMSDLRTSLDSEARWQLEGMAFAVAYDHANDKNAEVHIDVTNADVKSMDVAPAPGAGPESA
ncbi:hypothetical protein GCM10010411_76390 [Actinomadura fulvescens]|uniref:Uncharacterized protein n=1 Tax=Actinomadura fulvescens TaxID=46160 RepID=A0ABN3QJ71_9ACTN